MSSFSTIILLLLTLFSYLLGSISFGILLAKFFKLGNLREIGSGNIGTTNVLRTGNYWAAGLTLVLDFAKGLLPVLLAMIILDTPVEIQIVALAPLIGHIFPIWHRFKGGKGVATFYGIIFGISIPCGLICAFTWLVCAVITRIASASALVAVWAFPIGLLLFDLTDFLYLAGMIIALVWLCHLSNIKRLLKREESRIKFKK